MSLPLELAATVRRHMQMHTKWQNKQAMHKSTRGAAQREVGQLVVVTAHCWPADQLTNWPVNRLSADFGIMASDAVRHNDQNVMPFSGNMVGWQ
ncbi:unnamed protein product [Ceratitis capitata]|uniref:(Mediterranean fruit fly) hypothetical protein n=1 Tax=Ceratitis capitata TaxID=7213 RepID=A0A811U3T1_CERCA|nr:unnamed protein product [Ceratitis capitata]